MLGRLPYAQIWAVDFEYIAADGEPPIVVCMVAKELRTGRTLRYWQDDLERMAAPPFDVGPDSLYVAYAMTAEASCHLALGWPLPVAVFDCYVEFLRLSNGRATGLGYSLLAAMQAYGLDSITADEKTEMRDRILAGAPYSDQDRAEILDYCESDVVSLEKLLPAMLSDVCLRSGDIERAALRGRYMCAVARMQRNGIPIDAPLLTELRTLWPDILAALVVSVDAAYGVHEGMTFKQDRFLNYLKAEGIAWPQLPSGAPQLDADTFKQMARRYPQLEPLRELRNTRSELKLNKLQTGSDGRARARLREYRTKTGRNNPSSSDFIFGPATWIRSLIRPAPGRVVAYVDWASQEVGIAAALSGDARAMADYSTGDPYLAFAKQAGLAPHDATKRTHKTERDQCKAAKLGIAYGLSAHGLAPRLGVPIERGRQLIDAHERTYPTLHRWLERAVDTASLRGYTDTVYGWRLHLAGEVKRNSLLNFPMQANGAEMMRLACIAATEAGLMICTPVHDALLLESSEANFDSDLAQLCEIMEQASRAVLNGFTIRADAEQVIRYPDRYSDPRGADMFARVVMLKDQAQAVVDSTNYNQRLTILEPAHVAKP